jgi:branched-chain amino acid aminotransferase
MISIDGKKYKAREEAKISVYDHGLLYGDGVFEGIRIYRRTAFKLREHLLRLFASAGAIRLEIPQTIPELEAAIDELIAESGKEDGDIRLIVTRGAGDLGLNPLNCRRASVIIIVDEIRLYPKEFYTKGISVYASALRRLIHWTRASNRSTI